MKNRRAGILIIFLILFTVAGSASAPAGTLKDLAGAPALDSHTMKSAVVNAGSEIGQEIKEKGPGGDVNASAESPDEETVFADPKEAETAIRESTADVLDSASGVIAASDTSAYVDNEIYVTYRDGSDEVVNCSSPGEVEQNLARLSEDKNVAFLQPNYTYTMAEGPEPEEDETEVILPPNDPYFGKQWALYNDGTFEMDAQQSHPEYDNPLGQNTGEGTSPAKTGTDIHYLDASQIFHDSHREIIIALIDTGIDYTHPDLRDAFWTNEKEVPGNRKDDDGNGYVDDVYGWNFFGNNNKVLADRQEVHGTHVAGILAASSGNGLGVTGASLNPDIRIMTLKVLGGKDGHGSTASIVSAIRYAEANGASVCNLSLCSDANDQALYRAIAGSSMLFVTASGNTGTNIDKTPSYPASYDLDNIISVANIAPNGSLEETSNYGANSVDIAAPGTNILSTTPGNTYGFMTGTSMAAPMVTAAAATVYSHYEDIFVTDIPGILETTARVTDELTGRVSTGGVLDMKAALSLDKEIIREASANRNRVGSPPEIFTQTTTYLNRDYLVVKVRDMDGDLLKTAYSAGNLTIPEFLGGTAGRPFELNPLGIHVFTIKNGGTYTFYAADESGNETIKAVAI